MDKALLQLLQQTLDALNDSVDVVQNEHARYAEMYQGYPSRKSQIDLYQQAYERHKIAIEALEAALAQPEQPATKCKKCAGQMKPGQAIAQTFSAGLPDFPGDTHGMTISPGAGKLIDCLKCEGCGWSVTGTQPADQFADANKAMQQLTVGLVAKLYKEATGMPVSQNALTFARSVISAHIKAEKETP